MARRVHLTGRTLARHRLGIERCLAIDQGLAAFNLPDEIRVQTDDRVAAAHGAALGPDMLGTGALKLITRGEPLVAREMPLSSKKS